MFKYREHRGSLSESMDTVILLENKGSLVELVKERLSKYEHGLNINKDTVIIKPYIFDDRIDWDTHIVTLDGYGVLGFTNSEVIA